MKINYGTAVVNKTETSSSWGNLKFNTTLEGYQVVKKGEDQLDFEVKGAIALDPNGKKLQLDNIETPLGGLAISFDFAKKSFYGQLQIYKNLPLVMPPGLFTIYEGTAEVQIDGKGLLISGAFNDVSFNPIPVLGPLKCGLALGFYAGKIPTTIANNLRNITVQKQIPPSLENGLKGVYISVSKEFKEALELPESIPGMKTLKEVADLYAVFNGGMDIRTMINFNENPLVLADGFGFILAEGAVKTPLCDASIYFKSDLSAAFGYTPPKSLSIGFKTSFGANAKICGIETPDVSIKREVSVNSDGTLIFKPSF